MATIDTIANRPTSGMAAGDAYFETSSDKIVVWTGTAWTEIASDNAPASFTNTYSLSFDGTNDYGQSSYVASSSATALSYSFWMKSSNTTSAMTFGVSDATTGTTKSFRLLGHPTSKNFFLIISDGTGNYVNTSLPSSITGTYNVRDDLWHHMVLTVNGTSFKAYIDGGDASINASNTSNNEGTAFTATSTKSYSGGSDNYVVGRNGSNNGYYFDGLLDEVAIFEKELSSSEVRAIYNGGVPDDLSSYSPNIWWRMGDNDGGSGTTITDQGSESQNLTLKNGPTFSTTVPS